MSTLTPGRVQSIGDSIASGNAKVELRTGLALHDRRGVEKRHAFLLTREPAGPNGERGEVVVALDEVELSILRDACTDALRWVRR